MKKHIFLGILTILGMNIYGQLFSKIQFYPNLKEGMEVVWLNQLTQLTTNEKDAPIAIELDSLYVRAKVKFTDSHTWIMQLEHFEYFDSVLKVVSLPSKRLFKNAPIVIELDSNYNFLQMANWQQWSDTLKKNLKTEFEAKKIDLKTYTEYKRRYSEPEEVEKIVLDYYAFMFSYFGREVDFFVEYPINVELTNPFTSEIISKPSVEYFYHMNETPYLFKGLFKVATDEEDSKLLAEDYLNYLSIGESARNLAQQKPKVEIKQTHFVEFNSKFGQISEFRQEKSVYINGAGQLQEYHIMIRSISSPQKLKD
jgi:Fe-S-cluster formation regulator IscX/YfhJ